MKVSFSRKGFDSSNGGQPNVILPDGTLLPFPIPGDGKPNAYGTLYHGDKSLYDIISSLKAKPKVNADEQCHLDPDLIRDVKPRPEGWMPAFGQADSALSELRNHHFGLNDLFLFFGWFRETEIRNGRLVYKRHAPDMHLIYGYMQVGAIIKTGDTIPDWLLSHPHTPRIQEGSKSDAIYLPTDKLSFAPEFPGASMLKFSPELILTAPGMTRSRWSLPDLFKKDSIKIGHSPKQPADGSYFQSATIGQEMIWEANGVATEWLRQICSKQ